jgi:hypothetical protein
VEEKGGSGMARHVEREGPGRRQQPTRGSNSGLRAAHDGAGETEREREREESDSGPARGVGNGKWARPKVTVPLLIFLKNN